jgi:hypothetical protein
MNALEFVRTKFGAGATFAHPTGAAPEGSRSSELDAWHNWVYAEKLGGGWIRPVTPTNAIDPAFNEIALGLKAMNGNLAPA